MLVWRVAEGVDAMRKDIVENNLDVSGIPYFSKVTKVLCANYNHKEDNVGSVVMFDRLGCVVPKMVNAEV